MKAIRKSDGKIIDVEVHGWNGDCAVSYHTNFKDFYKPEQLDFNVVETKDVGTTEKPFDWQSFRAEAAKDFLCAMIAKFGTSDIDMNDVVKWADSLISKLKEKGGEK